MTNIAPTLEKKWEDRIENHSEVTNVLGEKAETIVRACRKEFNQISDQKRWRDEEVKEKHEWFSVEGVADQKKHDVRRN